MHKAHLVHATDSLKKLRCVEADYALGDEVLACLEDVQEGAMGGKFAHYRTYGVLYAIGIDECRLG